MIPTLSVLSTAAGYIFTPIGMLLVGGGVVTLVPKVYSVLYGKYQAIRAKIAAETAALEAKLKSEVKVIEAQLHSSSIMKIADEVEARVKALLATTPVIVATPTAVAPPVDQKPIA